MGIYDSKRKVVLIKGDKSKSYEQAIFILRAGAIENGIDFVKEAEKIMNAAHINNPTAHIGQARTKGASRLNVKLSLSLIIIGCAILAMLILNVL